VIHSPWPVSDDPVKQLIDRANALLVQHPPDPARVEKVVFGVAGLAPRDLVRFDEQSRAWLRGVNWRAVPGLRGERSDEDERGKWHVVTRRRSATPAPTDAAVSLWNVLGLVSGDGYERERAIRSVPMTIVTARLLTIRCIDWVQPVRDAALSRLDECPHTALVEVLPLAAQLAAERARGQVLNAFLDARLSDADLRQAYTVKDSRTRRAAWQRLAARGAATAAELREVAARDKDVLVRAVAANALPGLPPTEQRALAEVLVRDRVGWLAVPALATLVAFDGAAAIRPALTARTAALRRAARDWASIKDVDARSVYVACLTTAPQDALAQIALAEIGDPRDVALFDRMLDDPRSRVHAAGLRGLARVDRPAGRRAAIDALDSSAAGRVRWAAAEVLRQGVPTRAETEVLARIALDTSRAPGHRLSAMSLLRRVRWLHLTVLLEASDQNEDDENFRRRLHKEIAGWSGARVARAPADELRARIERLLPTIDARKRQWIEFVLRTSS